MRLSVIPSVKYEMNRPFDKGFPSSPASWAGRRRAERTRSCRSLCIRSSGSGLLWRTCSSLDMICTQVKQKHSINNRDADVLLDEW